jgi:hypothetical protein
VVSRRTEVGGGAAAGRGALSTVAVAGNAFVARDAVSPFALGTAEALSVADAGGRLGEKKRGVMTMTSAISASASSVRLSMQVVELRCAKGPDRTRPAETGDTAQFCERRAMRREARHDVRWPQWRTRNKLDNSGMRPAASARSRLGIRVPPKSESCAC